MASLEENRQRARTIRLPHGAVIDGRQVAARSGATFENISPRDGRGLGPVAACDAADVDAAVASGRAAFEDGRWRNRPMQERKRILLALAEALSAHADELALLETLDTGKPISDAIAVDIPSADNTTQYYGEALDRV